MDVRFSVEIRGRAAQAPTASGGLLDEFLIALRRLPDGSPPWIAGLYQAAMRETHRSLVLYPSSLSLPRPGPPPSLVRA